MAALCYDSLGASPKFCIKDPAVSNAALALLKSSVDCKYNPAVVYARISAYLSDMAIVPSSLICGSAMYFKLYFALFSTACAMMYAPLSFVVKAIGDAGPFPIPGAAEYCAKNLLSVTG